MKKTPVLSGIFLSTPVCKRNDGAKLDTSMKISHHMEFEA